MGQPEQEPSAVRLVSAEGALERSAPAAPPAQWRSSSLQRPTQAQQREVTAVDSLALQVLRSASDLVEPSERLVVAEWPRFLP
jgi:hypothetical protein